jgi:hypothetical protein
MKRDDFPLLAHSFFSLGNGYGPGGKTYSEFVLPFARNKICYFARQNVPQLLSVYESVPGQVHMHSKVRLLEAGLNVSRARWVFYSDMDILVLDHTRSLLGFLDDNVSVIFTDDNRAINNGAMLFRNDARARAFLAHWDDVLFGRVAPFKGSGHWPFTDNGAVWEAMAQIAVGCGAADACRHSYAGAHFEQTTCFEPFDIDCYPHVFTRAGGVYNQNVSRHLPGGIRLQATRFGFDNYECAGSPPRFL